MLNVPFSSRGTEEQGGGTGPAAEKVLVGVRSLNLVTQWAEGKTDNVI